MIQRLLRRLEYERLARGIKPFRDSMPLWPDMEKYRTASMESLRSVYDLYIGEVSRADMAASLELGSFLYAACKSRMPKRLLDLGSGFSSFVLRSYAKQQPGTSTVSVDDDKAWLEKTSEFLKGNGLPDDNLVTLEDFLGSKNIERFDFILQDLNFVDVRIQHTEAVLSLVAPGGVVVFDDVHKREYLMSLLKILRTRPGTCYSLKPVTLDRFNRFALAYVAP